MKAATRFTKTLRTCVGKYSKIEREPITETEIRQSLKHSYHSEQIWRQFVPLYTNLFSDELHVEQQARTHSLGIMCRTIRNRTGCSYKRIYDCLMKEIVDSKIVVHNEILTLDTKLEFIDSVFEIEL